MDRGPRPRAATEQEEMMAELKGVAAAILTPFDENDNVDLEFMKKHIRFIEAGGVQGLVPSGTNGEFPSMRVEERKRVFETCAANKGGLFMVAGCAAANLADTLELCKFAESVGTDAIMVAPPFFFSNAPEQGIIEYYKRVFDAVSKPVFLYNIPQHTGVRITDNIIRALERYPHLAGVKDSSGELPSVLHYIETFPNLKIFVGDDHQALAALTAGAAGHITGLPNAFPRLTTELYNAFLSGKDAAQRQLRLSMARRIYSSYQEFAVNKYVLSLRGFPLRYCRLPLLDLTEAEKARFTQLMKAHGLWDL